MSHIRIIFIPGNGGGTPNDNWFPYLKTEFEKLGLTVIAEEWPDNELARESYWVPFLKNELRADENTILIGHSSGAVAAMRFAEQNKILASVLVGVNHTDLGLESEKLSGYYDRPWDWNAIKNNQQWTLLFASIDDPCIPIQEPRFIKDKLGCEYFEFSDQGHFGGDYYKQTFPELLDAVKRKIIND